MIDRIRSSRLASIAPAVARIKRSDPFLMAAAIAYNTFFAIVPIAIALVATISLVGQSESALDRFIDTVNGVLPPDAAAFVVDLIVDTEASLDGSQAIVIVIALAVAIYSGSRAVYAVIKTLRLMQDTRDGRGWLRVRGLGILFTVGAGIALLVGQVLILIGSEVLRSIEEWTGMSSVDDVAGIVSVPVMTVWTILLFASIYRWGPPLPTPHPLLSGLITTVLVAAGSSLFGLLIPTLARSTIGILGTVGVALLWVYYMALIVIIVPELVGAAVLMVRRSGAG